LATAQVALALQQMEVHYTRPTMTHDRPSRLSAEGTVAFQIDASADRKAAVESVEETIRQGMPERGVEEDHVVAVLFARDEF
jgi:hypothetical protein